MAEADRGIAKVELVVHVGDGKTGTSAIQRMLRESADRLAAAKTAYLGLMFERAPVSLYSWQRARRIEEFHRMPAEQGASELINLLVACTQHARANGIERLIWSNESLLRRGGTAIRALQALPPWVTVTIVAYVRRHDRWARSAYLQWGIRHKTYSGRLLTFREWAAKRSLALVPKVQPWREAFGDRLRLRNYDAIADVTRDFPMSIGLGDLDLPGARRNLPPAPAELALRAAFNDMHEGRVAPNRFTTLFGSEQVDFDRSLSDWIERLLPTREDLAVIREAAASDAEAMNALLEKSGQPPLDVSPSESSKTMVDMAAVSTALMQMLAVQAQRIETLERRLNAIEPTASHVLAQAGTDAGISGLRAAPPDTDLDPDVVDALAPALGYFGAHPLDCLEVPVKRAIHGLKLSINEQKPIFLNLRGLELVRGGKAVRVEASSCHPTQSSVAQGENATGAMNLMAMRGIHSRAELVPWWQVRFDTPVAVDSLRIWNRSDGWGCRSRTLRVEELGEDGEVVGLLHDARSQGQLVECMRALAEAAGQPEMAAWPDGSSAGREVRSQLVSIVAERLRSGQLRPDNVAWRALLQGIDVWGKDGEPTDDTWAIIAAFLLCQHKHGGGTSLKAFSLLLRDRARLLRLQEELNVIAAISGMGRYMLTRHGVKTQGILRRDPEKFVSHLQAVISTLRSLGREPVMAYGTLLGAIRDGDFIAHDDDIDLLYRSGASSRETAEQDILELKSDLRARGFRVVDLLPNSLNMHVIDPANGAVMDIFPCWLEEGRLQMHMESMKVRGIDPGIVYPSRDMGFRGAQLPAPAKPEAFLRERYGDGWGVSDQFYEWPWPLKEGEPQ